MIEIADIKTSIQSNTLIQDDFFRNAYFLKDSHGRLVFYTGGYTVVVPCIVNNEKWAFRCWHVPIKNTNERYSIISSALQNTNLPYFCSFDYIEKGLLVNGKTLPITKMKWVDGQNLKSYICSHYQESKKMKSLAKKFLDMIINLHENNFAHGDLQHGNIIVSDTEQLFLVDYDSIYVPEMSDSFHDVINGLIDYQHPSRKNNTFSSPKLDYFSELIIYTSLLAIAYKPEFVQEYQIEDSECLLFKASDFETFKSSKIYSDLSNLNVLEINKCLDIIEEYLSFDDINLLQPIERYFISIDIEYPALVPINEAFDIRWKSDGVNQIEISELGKVGLNDSLNLKLSESKVITFTLISDTGFQSRKTIRIDVAHRAVINHFKADKVFTYDDVPVKLSWMCAHAQSVEIINIGKQNSCGSLIVTPKKQTSYTLCVSDDFGIQSETITIKIIPLPVINQILIPTPNINKPVTITYQTPNFKLLIPTPSFETVFSKVDLPHIPELGNSAFFIRSIREGKKKRIKEIFKYFIFSFYKKKIIYGH